MQILRHIKIKGLDFTEFIGSYLKRRRELSYGFFVFNDQSPVVPKVDNAIHRINHYPLDSAIGFANTYPLVSD